MDDVTSQTSRSPCQLSNVKIAFSIVHFLCPSFKKISHLREHLCLIQSSPVNFLEGNKYFRAHSHDVRLMHAGKADRCSAKIITFSNFGGNTHVCCTRTCIKRTLCEWTLLTKEIGVCQSS